MDISTIAQFEPKGSVLYQSDAPDDTIADFDTSGHPLLLIEMAAHIDPLRWMRDSCGTSDLTSVLYFGIADSPDGCLSDDVLLSLADIGSNWLIKCGDVLSGCAAGISRSSYANCAILMRMTGKSFDDVLAMLRVGRPQANPNEGFVAQLRRLQLQLTLNNTTAL
jgi:hypothetical protein